MSIENGCIEHQYYQTFARESEDNRVTRLQKTQTTPASGAFFQYSFERKFRSKLSSFHTAIYTCTSISVQTRGSRKRWFGNNFLLEAFEASGLSGWGSKVTHLISLALLGTCFQLFRKKIDCLNFNSKKEYIETPQTTHNSTQIVVIVFFACLLSLLELPENRWSCMICVFLMHWSVYGVSSHVWQGKEGNALEFCT